MKRILFWNVSLILVLALFVAGCSKDDPIPEPDPIDNEEEIPEADEVNKFIWEGLATYYYWVSNVSNLVNTDFEDDDSLNAFLNTYTDPEELFYDLLYEYGTVDKWSFIVDNSQEIDNWLTGISESMGFDFMLSYYEDNSNNIFGYVRYVLKGSPADLAGIKRGDFFLTVNGTQLTSLNYQELLFTQQTYSLGMAKYENNTFSGNGIEHTMTAVELQEYPILLDTVYNVGGLNVGYLVYNGFTSAYDKTLNNSYDILLNSTISKLKDQGIEKLIIDLRYNGGGSVQTSMYLASMIYGTNTSQVFAKYKYNNLLQNYFRDEYGGDYFNYYFSDVILEQDWDLEDAEGNFIQTVTTPETPIVSLDLNELYVITSSNTASASELLINGLSAYIDVIQIGTNTTGKNVGSFTIRDWIDDNNVNPNHSWAMQPITLKIANSNGYSDFSDGLVPDISGQESVLNLKQLGDKDETLLKLTLNYIEGNSTKSAVGDDGISFRRFKSSKDFLRFGKEMYVEPEMVPTREMIK
ncbi:S41 family peptidase [Maribellus comscasis]|nr:S41 family peptidase [Maribellus comscasis]